MGRDHRDQPQLGLSHHGGRPADDARGGLGAGHQHRLGPWPDGEPLQIGLYRGQARDRGLTKTTALETAEEPITANAICPGYVLTPLVEAQIPDTMKEYDMSREDVIRNVMLTRQPSKEFATVEQMGGTAVFLCSDAAAQITGTTISVDGAGRRCEERAHR
jgi:hypothetical protein